MHFLKYIPHNLIDYSSYEIIDEFYNNGNHCIIYRDNDITKVAIGNFKGNGTDVVSLFIWDDYDPQNELAQNRKIVSDFAVHFRIIYSSTAEVIKYNFPTSIKDNVNRLFFQYGISLLPDRGEIVASYNNLTTVEKVSENIWSVILCNNPYMTLTNEDAAKDIARYITSDISQYMEMRWL